MLIFATEVSKIGVQLTAVITGREGYINRVTPEKARKKGLPVVEVMMMFVSGLEVSGDHDTIVEFGALVQFLEVKEWVDILDLSLEEVVDEKGELSI